MKILVVSDTHGDNRNFDRVLERVGEPDLFIHCGDISGSEYYYEHVLSCPKVMVSGNNDWGGLRETELCEFGGLTILVTHGHRYHVSFDTEWLVDEAQSALADVVFYGHTHRPDITFHEESGIWICNPGSLSYPRQDGRRPSFLLMDIDREGLPHFTINYL